MSSFNVRQRRRYTPYELEGYGDLSYRQFTALQKYAAGRASGSDQLAQKGLSRLGDVPQEVLDAYMKSSGDVGAEEFLARLASYGPKQARMAARYESLIGERKLEGAAETARLSTAESIARGHGALEEEFAGYGLDRTSPAVQAALASYASSRGVDMSRGLNEVDRRLAESKAAARAGGLTPQMLVDMGDTVFALQKLEEEEQMLANARRAAFFGQLGTIAGGAVGGPMGAQIGGMAGAAAGGGGYYY